MLVETPDVAQKRATFFRYLFGESSGFIALATRNPNNQQWAEEFFKWPLEAGKMSSWISKHAMGFDVYYSPMLFARPQRTKDSVDICVCAWADLDSCPPSKLIVEPTITIESSPSRYQALWCFEEEEDPAVAEDISRRVAYFHAEDGADRSGWDLTQLLRVPFTTNHKYGDLQSAELPSVKIIATLSQKYTVQSFSAYPQAKGYAYSEIEYPEDDVLKLIGDADTILERGRNRLMPTVWHLFQTEPDEDWSKSLWQLQMLLFEGGLSREEVLVVTDSAACNKYKRDSRPPALLWKEICRAQQEFESRHKLVKMTATAQELLTNDERTYAESTTTIVEEYIEWAKGLGDAATQYHQAGGFVLLSSLLAGNVRLPTSFGIVVPNLWFMILADTTLTRKTTAMDVAMDLIADIDSDAVLATDGSIEGLFTSLSMRPGRPSIFLRDEFSGLLEAITKKDYYAGMAETLTKLYDGKFQKRVLRKETIEVRDPVLILFAGGIRERVLSLLTYEHVASGFLPRFVFITAESDITRLRPLGPPTSATVSKKEYLTGRFTKIAEHYRQTVTLQVNGRAILAPRHWDVTLTPDAWHRYNKFEADLLKIGLDSFHSDIVTPTLDRLSKSGLKVATLLSAARQEEDKVVIEESDLIKAFGYVETWYTYTMEVLNNIGRTTQEKSIEQIRQAIVRKPGLMRSELMQFYHLNARETDQILTTLEQRGVITRARSGRTERLHPIGV